MNNEDLEISVLPEDTVILPEDNEPHEVNNPFDNDGDDAGTNTQANDPAAQEAKKLRRQRRQQNIKNKLARADQIDQENKVYAERLAKTEQELAHLKSLAQQFQSSTLDEQILKADQTIQFYNTELAKAVNAADGNTVVLIQTEINKEREKSQQLRWQKSQMNQTAAPAPKQHIVPQEDPLLNHPVTHLHRTRFFEENPWVATPGDTDDQEDASLVYELDKQVAASGYRMNTPEYWGELRRLMKENMPDRYVAPPTPSARTSVGSSSTNASPGQSQGRMQLQPHQADALVRLGYLSEDRKTVLN